MNVGELKKIIAEIPDDYTVLTHSGNAHLWRVKDGLYTFDTKRHRVEDNCLVLVREGAE